VRQVPRRIAVPFLLAVVGVLLMLALVVDRALGRVGLAAYLLLVLLPAAAGVTTAVRRRNRLAAGRTCSCCTGTVHDPVQVI
jgi:hypothetical protein